jgi:hypothetical protein
MLYMGMDFLHFERDKIMGMTEKEKKLLKGNKVVVVSRDGKNLPGGYLHKVYLSLAVIRPDGSKVYAPHGRGYSPYWINNLGCYAYHYKTGFSQKTKATYDSDRVMLQEEADRLNRESV